MHLMQSDLLAREKKFHPRSCAVHRSFPLIFKTVLSATTYRVSFRPLFWTVCLSWLVFQYFSALHRSDGAWTSFFIKSLESNRFEKRLYKYWLPFDFTTFMRKFVWFISKWCCLVMSRTNWDTSKSYVLKLTWRIKFSSL